MINDARKRIVTLVTQINNLFRAAGTACMAVGAVWVVSREYCVMKSREGLVRLKRFQVNEKRRQLEQLDLMMGDFERMAGELDAQIAFEEKKSGISDPNHFAYPTFARAARTRRDNLVISNKELRIQHDAAQASLAEAEAELAKAEALEERDTSRSSQVSLAATA
jgi:flagellar export protein FliJ